mmetsp:Transcript_6156/g.13513  ORF Transcript_6156/g.13513 Transcript_6156/m.13513 type:complete len:205 (+) Transcript_6156:442-1056(+)
MFRRRIGKQLSQQLLSRRSVVEASLVPRLLLQHGKDASCEFVRHDVGSQLMTVFVGNVDKQFLRPGKVHENHGGLLALHEFLRVGKHLRLAERGVPPSDRVVRRAISEAQSFEMRCRFLATRDPTLRVHMLHCQQVRLRQIQRLVPHECDVTVAIQVFLAIVRDEILPAIAGLVGFPEQIHTVLKALQYVDDSVSEPEEPRSFW